MKIALLATTVLPLIYMVMFFASFALTVSGGSRSNVIFDNFGILMAVHLGVMLLMFALITFYIVFLFKTDRVKTEMKAVWAVAIFMGSIVAMPIFWYLYIWPSGDGRSAEPAA
ncbi:MAG TPA: hypothetical protein VF883_03745 [Thermoanaerobaculia bacterium]